MSEVNAASSNVKSLIIGRAWDNGTELNANGKQSPRMRMILDRNLGIKITVGAGTEFTFWPANKRDGKRDADYNVAINLPGDVVDAEIARQKAERGGAVGAVATTA